MKSRSAKLKKQTVRPTNSVGAKASLPRRRESKQQIVLDLLRRPDGATIAAITKATGWQQHSARGFLAGVVRKRLGLKLTSDKAEGSRVYRIPQASDQPKRRAGTRKGKSE